MSKFRIIVISPVVIVMLRLLEQRLAALKISRRYAPTSVFLQGAKSMSRSLVIPGLWNYENFTIFSLAKYTVTR